MKTASLLAFAALVCSAFMGAVSADGAAPDGGKNWSYKTNDPSVYGPAEWGLKYPNCNGKRQSPIDIVPRDLCGDGSKRQPVPLKLSGECSKYKVKQLYDAYKAESVNGTCQVAASGKPYNFLQTHFHAPAEHTVSGKVHDAEVHFVHQAKDGALLVVGLFLQKKAGATTDPYLANFWKQIESVNTNKTVEATMSSFFPALEASVAGGRVFNYPGSLTNPTCDETVDWWVLEKPLAVSSSDFDALQAHLQRVEATDGGKGARPVQPLNGRTITTY